MNVTPKELMLKKIRKALLEKREAPYTNLEEKNLYFDLDESLEIVFAQRLTGASGHFIFCEKPLDFIEALHSIIETYNWRKIYCWEPHIQSVLNHFDFPFYKTDKDFHLADVGITSCESLIARNGTILLSNASAAGRRLSIFPTCHIVVAHTQQLVPDIKDAFTLIKEKYDLNMPSMIGAVTGPSRTADIEKTLVLGAHGPKELFVFLLDDFSVPAEDV